MMSNELGQLLEGESGLNIDQDDSLNIYPNAEVRIVRAQYSILHADKGNCSIRRF